MRDSKYSNYRNTNNLSKTSTYGFGQYNQSFNLQKSVSKNPTNLKQSMQINGYQYQKPSQQIRNGISQNLKNQHESKTLSDKEECGGLLSSSRSLFQLETTDKENSHNPNSNPKLFSSDQKQLPQQQVFDGVFNLIGDGGVSCFGDVLSSSDLSATTSVSRSISKCDIANLENKIKQLENQITSIKDKHQAFAQQTQEEQLTKKSSQEQDRVSMINNEEIEIVQHNKGKDEPFQCIKRQLNFESEDPFNKRQAQNQRFSILSAPTDINNQRTTKSRNQVKFYDLELPQSKTTSNCYQGVKKSNDAKLVYGTMSENPFISKQVSTLDNRTSNPGTSAIDQLDNVLVQMFDFMSLNVEPLIEDTQHKQTLKSYETLTKNLVKSIKLEGQNFHRTNPSERYSINTAISSNPFQQISERADCDYIESYGIFRNSASNMQARGYDYQQDFDDESKRKSVINLLESQSRLKKKRLAKFANKSAIHSYKRAQVI
ncbi:UNKNOWN [Stylonychia lemnae]|uniref:Uncharacterized protein n=1 Tax=Stylonychia lemnae TaxID=5949 RepID=A0A078AKI4_STYLE|nr:UNKNOWN [Stylonychia lemnae]|eukprot:CDW82729.1 UNKNOWN [Stylonychia lemnae]